MHIKLHGMSKKFQVEALGVMYLTAILAFKNNLRTSIWEVYIAEKDPNPKAAHTLKFLLSSQVRLFEGGPFCRHVRN